MRVVVLDFQGTLTPLPDPLTFVRELRAQGDFVILWSGSLPSTIEEQVPGLLDEIDSLAEKPEMPSTFIDAAGVTCDEVVVVDDEQILGRAALRFGRGRPESWRFVSAEDILGLKKP